MTFPDNYTPSQPAELSDKLCPTCEGATIMRHGTTLMGKQKFTAHLHICYACQSATISINLDLSNQCPACLGIFDQHIT